MSEIVRYSDEQRHMVMLIWGFRANRNAAEVSRLLSTEEYRDLGLDGLPRQTVLQWSKDHKWAGLVDRELYREAPVQRYRTQAELILAAPEAARYLRDTLTFDASTMTKEEIMVMKIKSENSVKLLDRTGFSPIGTRDVGSLDLPPEMEISDDDEGTEEDWSDPQWVANKTAKEWARLGKDWQGVSSGKAHKRAGG